VSEALELSKELVARRQRLLGPHHPETFVARNNQAVWTATLGQYGEAARLFKALLEDQRLVRSLRHHDVLQVRANLATYTGAADPDAARRQYRDLVPDYRRAFGDEHPYTLTAMINEAVWTARSGEHARALTLLRQMSGLCQTILGATNPLTLVVRRELAMMDGTPVVLPELRQILEQQMEFLPSDHQSVLETEDAIATITAQVDPSVGAMALKTVAVKYQKRYGMDHPSVLACLAQYAYAVNRAGNTAAAVDQLRDLLPHMERVFGKDDQHTILAREKLSRLSIASVRRASST
jgi:hypothetical protein